MIYASNEIIIDSKDIEVIIDKDVSLIDNNIDVKTLEPEYEITINRKEYNVVGDELYIPKRYEDAPQWLRDIIDNVTDVALSAKISEINNLTQSLNNLIDELEVAKNTYTMSVVSSNDINERINTAITTLNSSVMESDATILGVATTRVTPEQAQAISIDAIRASLNDTISGNSLGSIISGMQSTTTTGDYTNAQSIEVLQSTIEGNADSTATAIDTINTFAGIDETGAYTYTGLTGYLVDPNTGMIGGGQSELQNTITTTGDNVEAKFEYGSNIKIGGQYHNAGFGLKTTMTGGDGTIADPYNSEFWINAEKFKFTNNSMSGQATPFSIDATGLQPKITFNGKVSFNNVTDYTPPDISNTLNTNNDAFAQKLGYLSYADMVAAATNGKTIINGGYLRTSLIQANAINAGMINTYNLTASNATIQNGMISNAMISDASITNAKIADASITNAKIANLSVDTLKIQDEAVIVPRSSTGIGSATIYYTPYVTHSIVLLLTGAISAYNTVYRLYVNGSIWYESPSGFGDRIAINILGTLYSDTTYTITFNATVQKGYTIPNLQMVMLGVKK